MSDNDLLFANLAILVGEMQAEAIRSEAWNCYSEISQDAASLGQEPGEFVNFVCFQNFSVFFFYTDPFELFIVRLTEPEILKTVRMANPSMADIVTFRSIVKNFGKENPDFSVPMMFAIDWMKRGTTSHNSR